MNNKILRRTSMTYIVLLTIVSVAHAGIPISDGFDYPVGWPNGDGYSNGEEGGGDNGWGFLESGSGNHLGQDFNNRLRNDLGDPVYAISNGYVRYADDTQISSWTGVIIIDHKSKPGSKFVSTNTENVASMYAHLDVTRINEWVNQGDYVRRGQQIGVIGPIPSTSTGPHLHFEIRSDLNIGIGPGYSSNNIGWVNPSNFIDANRPQITPLIGDFSLDNNFADDTGTFDPRTNIFSLNVDIGPFGEPGDFPLVGDWNGDGIDTIGVYRPRTAEFFLDHDNDLDADCGNYAGCDTSDGSINFEEIGDYPIVGDWNGDGTDDIGVFRLLDPNTLITTFFLKHPDRTERIEFGTQADFPVIGDWDNDNTDDIGVFRRFDTECQNNAVFYLRGITGTGECSNPNGIPFGNNEHIPIAGKPQSDILTRIGAFEEVTQNFMWREEPITPVPTPTTPVPTPVPTPTQTPMPSGRSGGPDFFGYTFKDSNAQNGPTYEWIDIRSTGTMILPDSDDLFINGLPVGFFFNFYGTDYSQVSITNNGIVLASGGTSQWTNQPIGSSTPHNFISPFWDDIVTWGSAGEVYYQTIGEVPNRKFIVEWYDNQHYSSSPSGITFEAILYEGSNDIKFQYKDVDFSSTSYNNGASATVGIESADGRGLQYSYNEGVINPNMAILFKFPAFSGTNMYLSKNAPSSMDHGNTMTYTLYYNNFGSTTASNVVLQDTLPSNVEFISASDGGTYNSATRKVTWNIDSVVAFPSGRGSRTVTVRIPSSVPIGTVIQNTASISTNTLETRYDDNSASASTTVTGSNLPPNTGVWPINSNSGGTPSIYYGTPTTFTYQNSDATSVNINIHLNDGGSDITGNMAGGPPGWTYTTTFYPRHGTATVTYSIQGTCTPRYSPNTDIRNSYDNVITANDIENYIRNNYPNSPMLSEANIGTSFIHAGVTYNVDPAFLVATAELEGRFGTQGWAASHPEAHNTMGYGVPSPSTQPNTINSADSWGEMIERVAERIANGPYYYNAGRYTIEQIRTTYAGDPNSQSIANMMNTLYCSASQDESFNIYIDPAGYIYDLETGERISDANVWLQRSDLQGGWENVPTGQAIMQPDENPLTTGTDGQYQWDVIEGSYRVHVEAPNYRPADSIIVNIPPPVTDLHVGLEYIDTTNPTIESITIFPANTTPGSTINVSVIASDNREISEVRADNIQLTNNSGVWKGSIAAPSSIGSYTLLITAKDTADNTDQESVPYNVVTREGGTSISILPRANNVVNGNTAMVNVKVKDTQNVDDTFRVYISTDDVPAANRTDISWFDWTEKFSEIKSGQEIVLPLNIAVPSGIAGTKIFRVKVNSTTSTKVYAYDTGYLKIT